MERDQQSSVSPVSSEMSLELRRHTQVQEDFHASEDGKLRETCQAGGGFHLISDAGR